MQATRRRFTSRRKAQEYADGIPADRDAHVVKVKEFALDKNGYPLPPNRTLMEIFRAEEDHHDAQEN